MPEYTYEELIIDPTSEEAKNCIGKEVYYSDNPYGCLSYANNSNDSFCGILREIKTEDRVPFVIGDDGIRWVCIILKKKDPKPEYVPFESSDEFLKACCDSIQNDVTSPIDARIRFFGGIWLKRENGDSFNYYNVTELCDKIGIVIGCSTSSISWNVLLKNFKFLDGTPCGKIKE